MSAEFNLSLAIDEAGVVLYVVTGMFVLSQWMQQHTAAVQKHFGGRWDETRPVMVDIRKLQPPKSEWIPMVKEVFGQLDILGETKSRSAFIYGDSPGRKFMCEFYIKCRRAMRDDGREQRAFQRWEDGYAWATEGYLPAITGVEAALTPSHPA